MMRIFSRRKFFSGESFALNLSERCASVSSSFLGFSAFASADLSFDFLSGLPFFATIFLSSVTGCSSFSVTAAGVSSAGVSSCLSSVAGADFSAAFFAVAAFFSRGFDGFFATCFSVFSTFSTGVSPPITGRSSDKSGRGTASDSTFSVTSGVTSGALSSTGISAVSTGVSAASTAGSSVGSAGVSDIVISPSSNIEGSKVAAPISGNSSAAGSGSDGLSLSFPAFSSAAKDSY